MARLHDGGMSLGEIARRFGMRSDNVGRRLVNCGYRVWRARRISPMTFESMRSMYESGATAKAIADTFDISTSHLCRRLKAAGVKMRPPAPYPKPATDGDEQIAALYRAGYTMSEIQETFGLTEQRVRGSLKRCSVTMRKGGTMPIKDRRP